MTGGKNDRNAAVYSMRVSWLTKTVALPSEASHFTV
jgi:hypothetical protein